jgi:hypothetical protein
MPIAEAGVATANAARYLAQVCRHFSQLRRHASKVHEDESSPTDLEVQVDWSAVEGRVTFDGLGRCILNAGSDGLALHAEAADEERLQRVQELVGSHLERFGAREQLEVHWHLE